jgi:predicted nucleic acid-binding protein
MTVSYLAVVEFKSALCRKALRREITAGEIEPLFKLLLKHLDDGFYRPTGAHEGSDYEVAMGLIGKPPYKLRALDALHVAMAKRLKLDVLTCDGTLAEAVGDIGATVVFIDPASSRRS